MSAVETKALVRRFIDEVMNQGNIAAIDELLAPDFAEHEEIPPGIPRNREGVKLVFSMYHRAFSEISVTVDDEIGEGDKVASLVTVQATHTGEYAGIPPTSRRVVFQVFESFRIAGGQIVEHWGISDRLRILQQLGVIPA